LGTEQSGRFVFPMADLSKPEDREMLLKARKDAEKILAATPDLSKLPELKKLLFYRYGEKMDLSSVS